MLHEILTSYAPWIWFLMGALTLVGAVAIISPQKFGKLATRGSEWVDSNKLLSALDRRIDIDRAVLPFSRLLGFAVLASMLMLAVLLLRV
jgi:hypothetical protein